MFFAPVQPPFFAAAPTLINRSEIYRALCNKLRKTGQYR